MKSPRFMLSVVLLSLSTVAFAQSDAQQYDRQESDAQKPNAQMDHAQKSVAPKSEAQTSFDTMKTLAGDWEGPVQTDMPEAMKKQMGAGADIKPLHVSMRVTSRGNVL